MLLLQSVFTVLATLGTAVAYATVQRSFPEAGLAGTLVPATLTIIGRQVHAFFRSYCFVVGRTVRALVLGLATYAVQLGLLIALALRGELTLASSLWCMAAGSLSSW